MKATLGSNRSLACAIAFVVVAVWTNPVRAAFDTIVEHGASSNRVNAFILGDGYTKQDIMDGTYAAHAKSYFDYMFADTKNSDPFYRNRNYFNLYRVNVESNQSGATEPQNFVKKDTALGAKYQFDGKTNRLLSVNTAKADAALDAALAGSGKTAQMRFVTVNDSIYGGAGGKYAVYAGGSDDAREIALHEIAHSFDNLGDEYWSDGAGAYGGDEPTQGNLTTNKKGDKWKQWIGYDDPTGGKVGAYEGGLNAETGIYRPTEDSKMRTLGRPFNAVSREKIILDIYDIVRPLDKFTSNAAQLVNPVSLTDTRWTRT